MQWAGSVCKLGEELEAVESGLSDMGAVVSAFEPSKLVHKQYAYNLPFGANEPLLAARAMAKLYDKFPIFKTIYEDRFNQKYVGGGGITGNYDLITTFPVKTVEDLKGRKIAAAGPNIPWLEGTGAVGVQSNLVEAYTSFQTGVYEGWVMFHQATVSFKLHEQAPYVLEIGFGCIDVTDITVNMDVWNKLPAEVQDIMFEVGEEYRMAEAAYVIEKTNEALKVLQDDPNVQIYKFPEDQRQAWAEKLPNIPLQWVKEAEAAGVPGREIMTSYIGFLEEEGYTCPREWQIED